MSAFQPGQIAVGGAPGLAGARCGGGSPPLCPTLASWAEGLGGRPCVCDSGCEWLGSVMSAGVWSSSAESPVSGPPPNGSALPGGMCCIRCGPGQNSAESGTVKTRGSGDVGCLGLASLGASGAVEVGGTCMSLLDTLGHSDATEHQRFFLLLAEQKLL